MKNFGKKWPARHSKLSIRPPIGKLQILHPQTDIHIMLNLELANLGAYKPKSI